MKATDPANIAGVVTLIAAVALGVGPLLLYYTGSLNREATQWCLAVVTAGLAGFWLNVAAKVVADAITHRVTRTP